MNNKIRIYGDLFLGAFQNIDKIQIDSELLLDSNDGESTVIVNLEAPIVDDETCRPIIKTGPNLSTGKNSIEFLNKLNIKNVTLSNNHILDYGYNGLMSTLSKLDSNNIKYFGIRIGNHLSNYIEINDKKIAILNFSENEWQTLDSNKSGVLGFDLIDIVNTIKEVKSNNIDYIILIIHGGTEYYELPSPRFQKNLRFLSEFDVDAIICHHTHVVGGYEIYNGVPIYYGLGNFIFLSEVMLEQPFKVGSYVDIEFSGSEINFKPGYFQIDMQGDNYLITSQNNNSNLIDHVNSINSKISDINVLENSYEQFVNKHKDYISNKLLIRSNLLTKIFYRLGVKTNGYFKGYQNLLLNYLRCESHNELIQDVLINNYKNNNEI